MGRPGRSSGGGSHRSSGSMGSRRSSSRSHSSSRSSFSSSSSRNRPSMSSRSSRPSSSFGGGSRITSSPPRHSRPMTPPRHSNPTPPPPRYYGGYVPPVRTRVYHNTYVTGGYSNPVRHRNPLNSILNFFISMLIIFMVITSMFSCSARTGTNNLTANTINEEAVYQYAESQYSKLFTDESHLLLVYSYLEDTETDCAILIFGNDASNVISTELENYFWERYDDNYASDLNESQWLGNTFKETAAKFNSEKLNTLKNFNKGCYNDNLDWIYSSEKSDLIEGCQKFYETTGVQPYIILTNYEDIPGVVITESGSGKITRTIIICVVILVSLFLIKTIISKIIKQRNKEQEDLERTLNTPLEKFGDSETEEIKDKYDN